MVQRDVTSVVRRVLAADCQCEEADFDTDMVTITRAADWPGSRRYTQPSDPFVATMGAGVVVSVSDALRDLIAPVLASSSRDDAFSASTIAGISRVVAPLGQVVYGPNPMYTCSGEDLHEPRAFHPMELVSGSNVHGLYRYPGFVNALQYDAGHPQPDVLASVAWDGDEPVGIAGASADCDDMWQVGIDVLPGRRSSGVGTALVAHLTRAILDQGRVPYYSTSIANIPSQLLARRVGYRPAWTEIRTRPVSLRQR
jgi:GNAT superfamily N-acetyltransferase